MVRYWVIAAAMLLPLAADAAAPEETLSAPGLSQPVEILKDRWGISHIYAKNEQDLFFAQGYNAARDRLFQLEVWRRQATGTLAEILGPRELKRDIANRLFLYRGDLTQELNWYHPHGAAITEAFVRGINAYIDQTAKNPALLSPEFKMLGIKPGKWTPAVVISRFNGLRGNLDEEMNTALAVRDIGADAVKDLHYYQPADPDLAHRSGDRCHAAVQGHIGALRHPSFGAGIHAGRAVCRNTAAPAVRSRSADPMRPSAQEMSDRRADMGTNNWVVSGRLTKAAGRSWRAIPIASRKFPRCAIGCI